MAAEHGIRRVLVQAAREVAEAYQVPATPAAVVVRADGAIGSPVALGQDAIGVLVAETVRPTLLAVLPARNGHHHAPGGVAAPSALRRGEAAPALTFTD